MKNVAIFLLLISLTSCDKSQVDAEEMNVNILNYFVGFVACSGGFVLQTDTDTLYRAFSLPAPYDDYAKLKLPAPVWIRYKKPTGSCSQSVGLIEVVSIRPQ